MDIQKANIPCFQTIVQKKAPAYLHISTAVMEYVLKTNIMFSCNTDLLIKDEYVTSLSRKCGNNFRTVALISIHIT